MGKGHELTLAKMQMGNKHLEKQLIFLIEETYPN